MVYRQMFRARFWIWVLVPLQGVAARFLEPFGAWVLWGCRMPQSMSVSEQKTLMGLWSREQKFRFLISKRSRECDGVGKYVVASLYTGVGPA